MKDLRGLDDRVLPVAAARVAQWRDALSALGSRLTASFRAARVPSLRGLDDRYAGSGPLALLREVPQLGFIVIGLVFLAGTGTAVTREAERNRAAQESTDPPSVSDPAGLPGDEGEASDTLGPAVGDTVAGYRTVAAKSLAAAVAKGGDRVAFVSLGSYLTPGQLKDLLRGDAVQRVYLRARSGGKDAAQLPVNVTGDLGAALVRAYADAARGRAIAERAYQMYVDTLTVTTKEDQAFKDLYADFATSTGREARDFRSSCACVFAAVVFGSPTSLNALAKKPGVRAVEVASKDRALKDLDVRQLLPEVTGTVPAAQAPVDPP